MFAPVQIRFTALHGISHRIRPYPTLICEYSPLRTRPPPYTPLYPLTHLKTAYPLSGIDRSLLHAHLRYLGFLLFNFHAISRDFTANPTVSDKFSQNMNSMRQSRAMHGYSTAPHD